MRPEPLPEGPPASAVPVLTWASPQIVEHDPARECGSYPDGRLNEVVVLVGVHGPAQRPAGTAVDHHTQVQPALSGEQVGTLRGWGVKRPAGLGWWPRLGCRPIPSRVFLRSLFARWRRAALCRSPAACLWS